MERTLDTEPRYLREALPSLGDRGWDLRLHYDIKANVTAEQIGVMRRAGVYSVQPSIESPVDDVLARMDKGVRPNGTSARCATADQPA